MSKLKLFVENFLVYGVGGVISKIIPLIMVPIVTRIMPDTSYYGLSDLSNTVVSFGSALAVMGMYDAMYRMFFEKNEQEYKRDVCSTTLLFTIGTTIIVFALMILGRKYISKYFFGGEKYVYLVYLSAFATLVSATNQIISAPTRMQNKRKIYLVTNTVGPILSYAIALPLLFEGHYIIALPLATVLSGITMELSFLFLNKRWFRIGRFSKVILKQLLIIAIPLLPNFLIYWIFNSCDKVMITNILGTGAAGVYSVASKVGMCSQLIYMAFAGGWQFFAFSTMNEDNQVESNSKVFEYLGIISFSVSVFVFALSKSIFEILFSEAYIDGYRSAPLLFLAPLLQMLFQVACNQFIIIKKTWPNLLILSTGAIVNVILNLVLIPKIGIEGASLATLMGYAVSVIICLIVLNRMNLMIISKRLIIGFIVTIAYILLWRFWYMESPIISLMLAIVIVGFLGMLYHRELYYLFNGVKKKIGR